MPYFRRHAYGAAPILPPPAHAHDTHAMPALFARPAMRFSRQMIAAPAMPLFAFRR